jgi:hypothetical protein
MRNLATSSAWVIATYIFLGGDHTIASLLLLGVSRRFFSLSLSISQDVVFFAILVVGVAIWLAPSFGMTANLTFALDGSAVATITFSSILGIRLLLAPYWIWKNERESRIKAEEAANNHENRKTVRITLGEFLASGRLLMAECKKEDILPPCDKTEQWIGKVEGYLVNTLDTSYAERFHSAAGIALTLAPPGSETHKQVWQALFTRIYRLQEFVKELSHD